MAVSDRPNDPKLTHSRPADSDSVEEADSERVAAIEWAGSVRAARFGLRDQLRSGQVTLTEVLADARSNRLVGQVKLLWALESVPGARKVLTRRRLAELGLSESTRIGALTDGERELIVEQFGV